MKNEPSGFSALDDMTINLTIDMSRELVKAAGYRIRDDRWPYTCHHDHIRKVVPGSINPDGTPLSRSEVGMALLTWATGTKTRRGAGAEAYAWELIDGALKELYEQQPDVDQTSLAGLEDEAMSVLSQQQSRFIDELRRLVVETRILTPQ